MNVPGSMGPNAPPYLRALDHCLLDLPDVWRRPDFSGESVIHIVSDYSGLSENSRLPSALPKFRTYSFLFTAGEREVEQYKRRMREIRRLHSIDDKTDISYKGIHKNADLRRALPEIVGAINCLNGMVFTLVVENGLASIFGDAEANHRVLKRAGRIMKAGTLERALRIGYSVAYWLTMLVGEEQSALWLGDRDEIWNNEAIKSEWEDLMGDALVATGYSGKKLGGVQIFYVVESDETKASRDLLAIPDLAAGSLVRVLSDSQEQNPNTKEGMDSLLDIGGDQCGRLSHVIYRATDKNGWGELLKFCRATR